MEEERPWSELTSDLLSQIANRLGLIDLISFRSVCKQWKFSSSSSTAESESSPGRFPWLLLYGDNSQCQSITKTGEKYTIPIPELEGGATVLASNHGWLLVFKQGSLFFFCPFSRSKISLPRSPISNLTNHVAAFSAPPSDQSCAVAVLSRIDGNRLEMKLLRRGEEEWRSFELLHRVREMRTVKCATYCNGSFYFFDGQDGAIVFSVKIKESVPKLYRIVPPNEKEKIETLPFSYDKDLVKNRLQWLLKDASVSTCGTYVECQRKKHHLVLFNETIEASEKKSDGDYQLKGVWIHPRFFQLHKDIIW